MGDSYDMLFDDDLPEDDQHENVSVDTSGAPRTLPDIDNGFMVSESPLEEEMDKLIQHVVFLNI